MFYDKEIDVLVESTGIVDEDGIYHEGEESVLKTIPCDVQPITQKQAYEDFGWQEHCTYRIFSDVDEHLKIGEKIKYKGDKHKIVQLITWDDYFDILVDNA